MSSFGPIAAADLVARFHKHEPIALGVFGYYARIFQNRFADCGAMIPRGARHFASMLRSMFRHCLSIDFPAPARDF